MKFLNKKIKKDHIVNKTFSYKKGDTSLSFTLRIDIKQELKDFEECLKIAIQEVQDEILK